MGKFQLKNVGFFVNSANFSNFKLSSDQQTQSIKVKTPSFDRILFEQRYTLQHNFLLKLGQFDQTYFFNFVNILTIIDEIEVYQDILRIGTKYYEPLNYYQSIKFLVFFTDCFDKTTPDLLNQAVSRNYLEIDIGSNYFNLINHYLSTAYYYDLYPHLFKFYKLREMNSYIKLQSILLARTSNLNNYFLEETASVQFVIGFTINNSTLQFAVSDLRLLLWNQTYKLYNNMTVDNETQRQIMQKSLDFLQDNMNEFFKQNTYTLKSILTEGTHIYEFLSKFNVSVAGTRFTIDINQASKQDFKNAIVQPNDQQLFGSNM
ncbi:UNKNOWN [Stylonychia lemnae]|uniref:Uncharacterized protein n=1 Tax=Stylonychia lemnae TaxID=5949 RepID=A0A077ZT53_STYLE|nr:UNKNOWN [Stylonychia lemnae]|eukprot:CDW71646.1 UNKNOWN [Stylonychia lemnae]